MTGANPECHFSQDHCIAAGKDHRSLRRCSEGNEDPAEIQAMMDRMSVEATLKQMGKLVTPDIVHTLNGALNEVKK